MADLKPLAADYRRESRLNAAALVAGSITVATWYARQKRLVDAIHTAAYQEGLGRDALGPAALASLGVLLARQRRFLVRWRDQLQSDQLTPTLQGLVHRAGLYLAAANATYQRAITDRLGLPPLPAYPGDGSTSCLVHCHCFWTLDRLAGNGNWDAVWNLRPTEHCDECRARSEIWAPLEIRAGVIAEYNSSGLFSVRNAA